MIRTQEFTLKQEDFVLISMMHLLRSTWWLHGLLFFISLVIAALSGLIAVVVVVVLWLLLPFVYLALFFQQAYSRNNESLFRRRYFSIDNDFVTGFAEDDCTERVWLDYLVRTIMIGKYYLLFTSGSSFLLLPRDAFHTEADAQQFEGLLQARGLRR